MLSMRNLTTAAQAAAYFARDDYYIVGEQHEPSMWWGRGAQALGLEGAVDRAIFEKALAGELPTGGRLFRRADEQRRPGFDLTFSAPKSVSLLGLVYRDPAVVEAHEAAISRALGWLEKQAVESRITFAGKATREATQNLLVARFCHDTSRDLDPQLHTHCVVINGTQCSDGAWRAIANERFYTAKMVAGMIYRAELARSLEGLGYAIERTHTDGRFEVKGFDAAQLEQFSKRRATIEQALETRALTGAVASERVALRTRKAKREIDRSQLSTMWQEEARAVGLQIPTPVPCGTSPDLRREAAQKAVGAAIAHLAERDAAFLANRLLARALAEGLGRVSLSDVQRAIVARAKSGELLPAELEQHSREAAYTTRESLQLEKAISRACNARTRAGRTDCF